MDKREFRKRVANVSLPLRSNIADLVGEVKKAELEQAIAKSDPPAPVEEAASEEVEALGGFRPSDEVVAAMAKKVDAHARTTATPIPPPPVNAPVVSSESEDESSDDASSEDEVSEDEAEPGQTPTGSYEIPVEDELSKIASVPSVCAVPAPVVVIVKPEEPSVVIKPAAKPRAADSSMDTLDAPAVTEEDLKRAGLNTGEREWFANEPPPPFETEQLADSGPVSVPEVAVPASVAEAQRPTNRRVAMAPATPARLFWVNYKTRIMLAMVVADIAVLGLMALSGFAGYKFALRSPPATSGNSIAVDEGRASLPAEPDDVVRVEEIPPTQPAMPPPPDRGLTGVSGEVVRQPAREAFATGCRTAGTRRIPGVTFLCGRGRLAGADACNCVVVGRVL